jgi:hypothetical protein
MYTPTRLKRWTLPSNYMGASWPAYYSAGIGESRDSDTIERSNFRTAWAALDALNTDCPVCEGSGDAPEPWGRLSDGSPIGWKGCDTCHGSGRTVVRVEENHWAVGWVAWIAIHESNDAALKVADEFNERLGNYPILDGNDLDMLERDLAWDAWEHMNRRDRLHACERAHISPINALRSLASIDDPQGALHDYLIRP